MSGFAIGLFVIGFLLILLEIVAPGALFGILGVLCIAGGIFLLEDDWAKALIYISCVVIALAILMPIWIRYNIKKGKGFLRFQQKEALRTEDGYTSRNERLQQYVGKEARSINNLRPSGMVRLEDGTRLDVVARGEFIEPDVAVRIVGLEGTWLVVEKIYA